MEYLVSYKHTFGSDIITAKNEKQAKKKAIRILRKEFSFKEKFLMLFGVKVEGHQKPIHFLKDLIEEIEIYEDEEEEEE